MTEGTEQLVAERASSAPGYAGLVERRGVGDQDLVAPASSRWIAVPASESPTSTSPSRERSGRERVAAFDDTEREARHVEVVGLHNAAVLGGLAAEQRRRAPGDTPRRFRRRVPRAARG